MRAEIIEILLKHVDIDQKCCLLLVFLSVPIGVCNRNLADRHQRATAAPNRHLLLVITKQASII